MQNQFLVRKRNRWQCWLENKIILRLFRVSLVTGERICNQFTGQETLFVFSFIYLFTYEMIKYDQFYFHFQIARFFYQCHNQIDKHNRIKKVQTNEHKNVCEIGFYRNLFKLITISKIKLHKSNRIDVFRFTL